MTKLRLALLGTALLAVAALPVLAQPAPAAAPDNTPAVGPARPGPRGPAAVFRRVDGNGDGRVTQEEAWSFAQARFAEADRNRDGALVLEEALALPTMARPEGPPPRPESGPGARPARMLAMVFRAIDINRDGRVTLEEIRPAIEAQFRALDSSGDNGLTLDELPAPPRRGWHGPFHGRGPDAPPSAR